jgi:hypothetical protein
MRAKVNEDKNKKDGKRSMNIPFGDNETDNHDETWILRNPIDALGLLLAPSAGILRFGSHFFIGEMSFCAASFTLAAPGSAAARSLGGPARI